MFENQIPPQAIEIEQSLLCACLVDGNVIDWIFKND